MCVYASMHVICNDKVVVHVNRLMIIYDSVTMKHDLKCHLIGQQLSYEDLSVFKSTLLLCKWKQCYF